MKYAFTLLILLMSLKSYSETVYVSSSYSSQPNRPNNLFAASSRCYRAGDSILLRGGETFYGSLNIRLCADSDEGAVRVSIFGSGGRATILNSTNLNNLGLQWEKVDSVMAPNGKVIAHLKGKNIYRVGPIQQEVRQLFYQGQTMESSRQPNKGKGLANFVNHERIDRIHDNCGYGNCMGDDDSVGIKWLIDYGLNQRQTKVVVRDTPWSMEKKDILHVSGSATHRSISFEQMEEFKRRGSNSLLKAGNGYFLMNHIAFLDQEKEWFYDTRSKYLYFVAPGDTSPKTELTRLVFKGETPTISADFKGKNVDLLIYNLNILQSWAQGVRFVNGRNFHIRNSKVSRSQLAGVVAQTLSGDALIENTAVSSIPGSGIAVYRVDGEFRMIDSTVSGVGWPEMQNTLGVNLSGVRTWNVGQLHLENNDINHVGFGAFTIGRVYGDINVTNNKIYGYCLVLNDCGGIYVNANSNEMQSPANRNIVGNRLTYPLGNTTGQPPGSYRIASGVYLDFWGSYFNITDNVIYSRSIAGGINIHGGDHNYIAHNKVDAIYGNAISLTRLRFNGDMKWNMLSNTVIHNEFHARNSNGYAVRLQDFPTKKPRELRQTFGSGNSLSHGSNPNQLWLYKGE